MVTTSGDVGARRARLEIFKQALVVIILELLGACRRVTIALNGMKMMDLDAQNRDCEH
jgi:hypothetical protein